MNVLFFLHGLSPHHNAGAELTAQAIGDFLASQGHTVKAIVNDYERNKKLPHTRPNGGVQRHGEIESFWSTSEGDVDSLFQWADVAITHLDMTQACIRAAQKFSKPVVVLIHNIFQLNDFKPHEVGLLVYNSYALLQMQHQDQIKIPSLVVHPPVDPVDYPGGERRDPSNRWITLINLVDHKGSDLFWQLARKLSARNFMGVQGSYGVQKLDHLPNTCILPNSGNTMDAIYQKSDIVIMPSTNETWGRVALEATWAGVPVLAHKSAGLEELMGDTAVWCNRDKIEEWEEAINLLDDNELYAAWTAKALARAQNTRSDELIQLEAFNNALQSLVSTQKRRLYVMARMPHYLDHCCSVMHSIPPEGRGFTVASNTETYVRAIQQGLPTLLLPEIQTYHKGDLPWWSPPDYSLFLVASQLDQRAALSLGPVIRMEHGAGQVYGHAHNVESDAFAGGPFHGMLHGFLSTGPVPTKAQKTAHPKVPIFEIGCPKLDPFSWYGTENHPPGDRPVICFSFHWSDHPQVPERRGAFVYYQEWLKQWIPTVRDKYILWGHAHPRSAEWLMPFWKELGVTVVEDLDYVLGYAQVYVCDNSSSMFEFAALNKSVVFLNAPWYNKGIELGVRFWEGTRLGYQVNIPEEIPDVLATAVEGAGKEVTLPRLQRIYAGIPGMWGDAAREAIQSLSERREVRDGNSVLVQAIKTFADGRYGDPRNNGMVKLGGRFWIREDEAAAMEKTLVQRVTQGVAGPEGTFVPKESITLGEIRDDVPDNILIPKLIRYWRVKHAWKKLSFSFDSSKNTDLTKSENELESAPTSVNIS